MGDLLTALRVIVALAAVLGLLWWLSRRLQKGQATSSNPLSGLVPKKVTGLTKLLPSRSDTSSRSRRPEKIHIVARSALGGKSQLVVAEFDGIRYVLGVTESGVSVVDTQEAPVPEDVTEHDIAEIGQDAAQGRGDSGEPALKSVA